MKEIPKRIILIQPNKEYPFKLTDFSHSKELLKDGEKTAKKFLKEIKM